MRTLALIAALCIATPAVAQTPATSATLAAPRPAAMRVIIDGASWRCDATACTASGGANQPAARACRRAVARLGAVTAFTYRGVTLSAAEIAACNA